MGWLAGDNLRRDKEAAKLRQRLAGCVEALTKQRFERLLIAPQRRGVMANDIFPLIGKDVASFLRAVTIVISDIHNLPVNFSKSPLTVSSPQEKLQALIRHYFLEIM